MSVGQAARQYFFTCQIWQVIFNVLLNQQTILILTETSGKRLYVKLPENFILSVRSADKFPLPVDNYRTKHSDLDRFLTQDILQNIQILSTLCTAPSREQWARRELSLIRIIIPERIPMFPFNRILWCYARKYSKFAVNLNVTYFISCWINNIIC